MSHGMPWMWTGIIARVCDVMRDSICVGSMQYVAGSMSTKIGMAW